MEYQPKPTKIVLEDAKVFDGISFGAYGEVYGEIVFNTSLTGYQEILTDPSYKGQIVTMTYPLIGNYGVCPDFAESRKIFMEGFVVKECSSIASNWQSRMTLRQYLQENKIMGVEGVDTRALTRHLRIKGSANAIISTEDLNEASLLNKVKNGPRLVGRDLVKEVTIDKPYRYCEKGKYKVVASDCGIKNNILRQLKAHDCQVTVVPYSATAQEILSMKPDGLFLSNGPGDPEQVAPVINMVADILGKLPIFGICLGHQMLGLALGGKTYKLKFGHHGGNHPVKDLRTGRIAITAQNHGFCVDIDSLKSKGVEITHVNLNDNTLEGMRCKKVPAFSVQFHPEDGPGPHDARYLFGEFITMMQKKKNKK